MVLLSIVLLFWPTDMMVALNRAGLALSISVMLFQENPLLRNYYWLDYWQRMVMVAAPFISGPLTELIVLYQAHKDEARSVAKATLCDSQAYTVQWFGMFALFLLLQPVLPYCVVSYKGPRSLYGFILIVQMVFGCIFMIAIPPKIMGDVALMHQGALLLVSWVVSVSIFYQLDRTMRSFALTLQVHERFIATLSHDFGTPIIAMEMAAREIMNILTGVDLVRAKPLIDGMNAALQLMKALKQKALDIASLQQDEKLTPRYSNVDLRELILVQLPALFRYVPHSEKVEVEYHVSDEVPQTIVSDAWWILMILLNLTSNAFKFTKDGYVRISAHMQGEMIRLTVADTGTGVPDFLQNQLWKAFAAGRLGGHGIGLYHVSELAGFLGGSVGHQSNDIAGNGAIFWAELPHKPATDAHTPTPTRPNKALACLPISVCEAVANAGPVLLVEDDIFIQNMTVDMLKSLGLTHVVVADNGVKALEVLQAPNAPKFALVLMDLNMPQMDGTTCMRRIRAWEREMDVQDPLKVFALSANGNDPDCQQDCEEAGFDGIFCKPLDREVLTSHLRTKGAQVHVDRK